MNILFVIESFFGVPFASFHRGIGSMAAVLKKNGHRVDLFCLKNEGEFPLLFKRIKKGKFKLIGLTAVEPTSPLVAKIAKKIKEKFDNNIKVICGGLYPTLHPNFLEESPNIDAICLGEGEETLLDFVTNLENNKEYWLTRGFWVRRRNKIYKNSRPQLIKDLNKLPFPDRELFVKEGILWINYGHIVNEFTTKGLDFRFHQGCPFDCSFCVNHALRKEYGVKSYVRKRSVQLAIQEIKDIVGKYGCDYLFFHDDTFTLDRKWLFPFLKRYKEINLPFYADVRIGTTDWSMLNRLKKAGCKGVMIGVETGNEDLRMEVLNKKISNKETKKFFRQANKLGIKTFVSLMIGFPGDTPKKFLETIKFMAEIKPTGVGITPFYPYRDTVLGEFCRKNNLIKRLTPEEREQIVERVISRNISILELAEFKREDIIYYSENGTRLWYFASLAKNNSIKKKLVSKLAFYLLSIPPSSKLFSFSNFLFNLIFITKRIPLLFQNRKLSTLS